MASQILNPEILIIGAGPGGSVAAHALARLGHDVLLIDAATFPRDKTCGDGLTPLAVKTLDELGVLPAVEGVGAVRIDHTRIKGPFGVQATMRFADFHPDHPYALTLPRYTLDDTLRQHAVASGVEFMGGVRVDEIERAGDAITRVQASTSAGSLLIEARHVVIAVGANIGLLKRTGFITHKPRIIRAARAYYTNIPGGTPYYDFYFDGQLLPGYGWVFPVGSNRANIGVGVLPVFWSTNQSTRSLLPEFLQRRVADGLIGENIMLDGAVKGYPLRIDFPSQRVAGANWVVIGEAAGLVNPVTGEGIDLAMESALIAARTVHQTVRQQHPHHAAYDRELWERFGPMFTGLRIFRDILVTPFFTDYALWLMRQHEHLTATVMKVAQGMAPPGDVFHPLFILQFFLPITPRLILESASQWDSKRR